jgi:RIO-like serine/threonine protein kinase
VTNRKIEKGATYEVDVDLQCYDEFTIKMETTEGFHTKTIRCSNDPNSPSVSETFVTRMSSLVKEAKVHTDFNALANDIVEPIQQDFITDES